MHYFLTPKLLKKLSSQLGQMLSEGVLDGSEIAVSKAGISVLGGIAIGFLGDFFVLAFLGFASVATGAMDCPALASEATFVAAAFGMGGF